MILKNTMIGLMVSVAVFGHQVVDVTPFEAQANILNLQASKNEKIKCRVVCDKKIYKEQKIEEAIMFYKNSKDYKFTHPSK